MSERLEEKLLGDPSYLEAFANELQQTESSLTQRVNADPKEREHGLAKLVLTLIDLLRYSWSARRCTVRKRAFCASTRSNG